MEVLHLQSVSCPSIADRSAISGYRRTHGGVKGYWGYNLPPICKKGELSVPEGNLGIIFLGKELLDGQTCESSCSV